MSKEVEAAQKAQNQIKKQREKRPGSTKYRDHQTSVLHALEWVEDTLARK